MISLQGCTVGWYSLQDVSEEVAAGNNKTWNCPANFELDVNMNYYTNTYSNKKAKPENISKIKRQLSLSTEKALKDLGCLSGNDLGATKNKILFIKVTEQKYLSALPQEWLTGLSFGIIPSWGTRPGLWQFEFKQGDYERTFSVDDTRFNHLIALPVFWLSFPLMNIESEFEKALNEFVSAN